MKAVLIISHGSRSSKTKDEVLQLIERIKQLATVSFIECAFLEIESPLIPDGIEKCVSNGATNITILLNFLNSGRHVDVDIPAIIEQSRRKFPHVKITLTKPVGQHDEIPRIFAHMLKDI